MPPTPHRPAHLHRTPFRGSAAVASGALTKNQLRSSAWQRLFQDVYVCACARVSHEVRATAATWVLLPGAVVSGRSAAVLWGVGGAGDTTTSN